MSTTPPPLAADLNAGLRRLKLAAMRRLAPDLRMAILDKLLSIEEKLRRLLDEQQDNPPDQPGP